MPRAGRPVRARGRRASCAWRPGCCGPRTAVCARERLHLARHGARHRCGGGAASLRLRVPGLRAVPAPERLAERGLPAARDGAPGAAGTSARAARAVRARGPGRCAAAHAERRRAPAGGGGASAGEAARGAAARRAAVRARLAHARRRRPRARRAPARERGAGTARDARLRGGGPARRPTSGSSTAGA